MLFQTYYTPSRGRTAVKPDEETRLKPKTSGFLWMGSCGEHALPSLLHTQEVSSSGITRDYVPRSIDTPALGVANQNILQTMTQVVQYARNATRRY